MSVKPQVHGRDHRPGGADPTETGPWHNVGDPDEPTFLSGSNMAATAAIPNPVPLRFRLAVGPQNILADDGTVDEYTEHQIEIQGDVTGLSPGDTVFVLPAAYRHDHDVPVAGHDDAGNYVACRLLSTGEFIYGTT